MKKLAATLLLIICFSPACTSMQKIPPEEQFKKSFPNSQFESITPTTIKGVYEVYNGKQIYYYLPEPDVVFYGNIISKEGKNLTRESSAKKMTQRMSPIMAKLPLESALKIGNGKTAIVEFIDPNCHYCRESFKYFSGKKDLVTLYVFFYPLSQDSESKIRHIFCSKDRIKTYEDVLAGKLDNNAKLSTCSDKEVDVTIKMHIQLALQAGVRSTPLFYIKGQVVDGFDVPAIEKLLKD